MIVKSPLEVTTKAGKLIVSVVEDMKKETPKDVAKVAPKQVIPQQQRSIEVLTKNATLLVHANTRNNKLDGIVLEQINKKNTEAKPKIPSSDDTTLDSRKMPTKSERRERVDFSRSSLERNFITPARAISDFLLKMSDLESLPKTKRRSPYEQEPPIIVYWRKDVEAKAIEVWGSRENLLRECLKREIERKQHQQSLCFDNTIRQVHQNSYAAGSLKMFSFFKQFVRIRDIRTRHFRIFYHAHL